MRLCLHMICFSQKKLPPLSALRFEEESGKEKLAHGNVTLKINFAFLEFRSDFLLFLVSQASLQGSHLSLPVVSGPSDFHRSEILDLLTTCRTLRLLRVICFFQVDPIGHHFSPLAGPNISLAVKVQFSVSRKF